MLRKVLCACALSLLSFGCSHGTWVVKPEGSAKIRDWKYTAFSLPRQIVGGPLLLISGGTWQSAGWDTVGGMCATERGVLLEINWKSHLLLSPQNGEVIERWSVPRELFYRDRWYRGPQRYGDCFFHFDSGNDTLVEWSRERGGVRRRWSLRDALGRGIEGSVDDSLVLAGDRLIVGRLYPDECRLAAVDLLTGALRWSSSFQVPQVPGRPFSMSGLAQSGSISHWQMVTENSSAGYPESTWTYTYFAVHAPTGMVLDLWRPSSEVASWYKSFGGPGFAVDFDPERDAVTVLRGREILQRRRDTGEVVWRGEFTYSVQCLGPFAVHGDHLLFEFVAGLPVDQEAEAAGLLGTYTLSGPSGDQEAPLPTRLQDKPIKGMVAIDRRTGRLLWATTLTAVDLGSEPRRVRSDYLVELNASSDPPVLMDRLVILRPISFAKGDWGGPISGVAWHYLVGLDAATGETAFIWRTHRVENVYKEECVIGFLAVDRVVCFSTTNGRVYGLDLSELANVGE